MKANRIRLYYGIFLSLLTAALGAFFIAQSVVILADGNWQQGACINCFIYMDSGCYCRFRAVSILPLQRKNRKGV